MPSSIYSSKHIRSSLEVRSLISRLIALATSFVLQWLKSRPGVYQMSTGVSALAFIPSEFQRYRLFRGMVLTLKVPIGASLDIVVVLWWERHLERAKARRAPWALNEEYRRMPLACIGGPLCALSLFWLVRPPLQLLALPPRLTLS